MWYEISAEIPGLRNDESVVLCFDPVVVIRRLQKAFPNEVTVCLDDYAMSTYLALAAINVSHRTLQVAENDARRRGPILIFRMHSDTKQKIRGQAERHRISILSQQPIPDTIKSRFIEFLNRLEYHPFQVQSVRIDGNDVFDA